MIWPRSRPAAVGAPDSDEELHLETYGVRVLVAGPSGSGKSTLAIGLLEQIVGAGYQLCVLDPEGDYGAHDGVPSQGDAARAPDADEVLQVLRWPAASVAINLLGVPLEERPARGAELVAALLGLWARRGRPHWIVLDEAHHLLPAGAEPELIAVARQLPALAMITVHPDRLARAALDLVDVVLAVGDAPIETLIAFARAAGLPEPQADEGLRRPLRPGEALAWRPRDGGPPVRLCARVAQAERNRHRRKYAQGDLGEDKSFYFRGPDGRLNLRAQNLMLFLQIGEGVDDATWTYHLRHGDYTRWFEEAIKDPELAATARELEHTDGLSPADGRARLRSAIERDYTAPAR